MNAATHDKAPGEAVVADYLANRLNEAEALAFEHYCLEHPDFARDVERELALKTGLRQVYQPAEQVNSLIRKRTFTRWPLALAASVAIIVCAVLAFEYSINKRTTLVAFTSTVDIPDKLRRSAVSHVTLVRLRGTEAATLASVSVNGMIDMRLLPDIAAGASGYSLQIAAEAPSATKPLLLQHLKPDADGYLRIYLPANPMIGRSWLISLAEEGDLRTQKAEVFRVRFASVLTPSG